MGGDFLVSDGGLDFRTIQLDPITLNGEENADEFLMKKISN